MLGADAAVAQGLGLGGGLLQGLAGVRGQAETRRAGAAHAAVAGDHAAQMLALQALAFQNVRAEAVLLFHDPQQQMLRADVGVAQLPGGGPCGFDGDLRALGKFLVAPHGAIPPVCFAVICYYPASAPPKGAKRGAQSIKSSAKFDGAASQTNGNIWSGG